MRKPRIRCAVTITLTLGREPEHLLRRTFWQKGRMRTACGLAPYTDGAGRQIRSIRDGRKVDLCCKFCREHLHNLLQDRGGRKQGELFD